MPVSDYYRQLRERVGKDLLLIPAVAAVIRDESGRLLLQGRTDGGWSLPAGAVEPGETPQDAVVREVAEETGLVVSPVRILGAYGGAGGYRTQYPNGDQVEYVVTLFECEVRGGELRPDGVESAELKYFARIDLPELTTAYPPDVLFT